MGLALDGLMDYYRLVKNICYVQNWVQIECREVSLIFSKIFLGPFLKFLLLFKILDQKVVLIGKNAHFIKW